MVDEYKDNPLSNSVATSTTSRAPKKDVDLFPALADRRMVPINSLRQAVPTKLGTQISIFNPVSFEEAIDIVECLRSRAATTITLENMKTVDANRLVDFVAGASAALDGDFHKLSEKVYVFCPSNVRITVPSKIVVPPASPGLDQASLDFLYPSAATTDGSQFTATWNTTH